MADCFNEVEVLWVARFDYKSDWILSPHTHKDFYQLVYCIDGSFTCSLNDRPQHVTAPMVLFFPPGVRHGFKDIAANGLKTLDTKFKIHSQKLADYCYQLPYIIQLGPGEIYKKLDSIRENGNSRDILYEEMCQLILGQILIGLIRLTKVKTAAIVEKPLLDSPPNRELHPLVHKVIDYIKNHYQERLEAETLEQNLHYSYRHLSKSFFKEMKMTPVQFIERYKILKAKELLKNTEFEIKYISEILSYSDVHQFSRAFKKYIGIPPAQWRKTAWGDICKDIVIHSGFENTLFIQKIPI